MKKMKLSEEKLRGLIDRIAEEIEASTGRYRERVEHRKIK